MERRVQSFDPDLLAASVFAAFNTYLVARTLDARAILNPDIVL